MINKQESTEEKTIKNHEKQLNEYILSNDEILNKNKLIECLEIQIKESQEKILKKEKKIEQEMLVFYKRINKEIEQVSKFFLEKFIIDFLPICDNIERALQLVDESDVNKNFLEISNKLKSLCNLLQEFLILFNIQKIDDMNVLFNPSIHQAMSMHYTDEIESNQIVTIMQPGYILHKSRLLRPALVVVSKKKI